MTWKTSSDIQAKIEELSRAIETIFGGIVELQKKRLDAARATVKALEERESGKGPKQMDSRKPK